MPSAAVEVVRAAFDALDRWDVEAAQALVSDDAEIFTLRAQLEGRAYRGGEGFAEAMADAESDWGAAGDIRSPRTRCAPQAPRAESPTPRRIFNLTGTKAATVNG